MAWLAAAALTLAACGNYVEYQDGPPTRAPVGDGADDLDDDTRAAFEGADRLDHLAWEGLLSRFTTIDADGVHVLVDYDGLAASAEAGYQLEQYLGVLDLIDPAQLADGDERLAFWINAYNANVVLGVIQVYGGDPAYSVSNTGFSFFDEPIYRVSGALLSLNQIEQGIIRGDLDHPSVEAADADTQARIATWFEQITGGEPADARIHVALNCASLGCPNLPASGPYAYRGDTLDAQLDAASRAFVNNPIKGAGPSGVSQLLTSFYPDDFVPEYGDWQSYVRTYADDPDAIEFGREIQYDWTLNIVGQ